MKMKFTEKELKIIRGISLIAGIFTLIVGFTMIFSFIQLKTINPLDNPALLSVKEQYDKDPGAGNIAEQVRAMDLMARKAYFATRRQVETGSYLLLAGAVVFIFCSRLIAQNEKVVPSMPGVRPDQIGSGAKYRKYLLISASVILAGDSLSFLLRSNLPDLSELVIRNPRRKVEDFGKV
jgi:hypothetical protein